VTVRAREGWMRSDKVVGAETAVAVREEHEPATARGQRAGHGEIKKAAGIPAGPLQPPAPAI